MKKVVLIDGNNLLFRSFYATSYTGVIMRNSKGFPTNALYGFIGMIHKIIEEEQPEYMVVAFDIGKNFRKQEYEFYKEGRVATPEELKIQLPLARDILDALGISYKELSPYEADDIIGTISKHAESNKDYYSLIVSSDKDLLQLISDETEIKLLKQNGFIRYNGNSFKKEYGIDPIRVIDLKALMGDSSDNIPGVKGIGEKTALKLLQEYKTLDNIYNNIDLIKGKLKEKLVNDKNNAYLSYKLATIYQEVPIKINFEDFKYRGPNKEKLIKIYETLEFYSLLKNLNKQNISKSNYSYLNINDIKDIKLEEKMAFYLELDNSNYHIANYIGLAISTKDNNYFVKKELINDALNYIKYKTLITYDLKKVLVVTNKNLTCDLDIMVASYLLNMLSKDDLSYLMTTLGGSVRSYDSFKKDGFNNLEEELVKKSRFLYDKYDYFKEELNNQKQVDILNKIEMPLIYVLADMERNGFKYHKDALTNMRKEVITKLDKIQNEIYDLSGEEFNISSPKQLGEILFDKLKIGYSKKNERGYKTDVKTLEKYIDKSPIINKVLEYRNLSKLLNTYIDGLDEFVLDDGKIHTIFNQTLTRTGRLSSSEPNLQNIPVHEDYGKKIRLAFVPDNDLLLSADYSQIELRILAHISQSKQLITAFKNGEDIHTKVASDIHGIKESEVTKEMRSTAKAVIFGIVYGISSFGLGENLKISREEANNFIKKYYELYPGVKKYMDEIVKKAYQEGQVETIFGRIRKIDELKNSNYNIRQMGERMALNTPIQGTSADIMKLAMIKVYDKLKENNLKSKMVLQVHDEIIIDAKKEEIDILKKIIKDSMENIVKLSVPLKVEISMGVNWYEI